MGENVKYGKYSVLRSENKFSSLIELDDFAAEVAQRTMKCDKL